jgi:hypothetical protein
MTASRPASNVTTINAELAEPAETTDVGLL